jgi:predicted Rossmann fold nucleotide-binding protein DprA/Smf involved in DNA uptake
MGYYWRPYQQALDYFFEWLFSHKRKRKKLNKKLPIKRVVVAGSRTFTNYKIAKEYIDFCLSDIRKKNEIIIVSGGAKGSDALGERYAKQNGFEIEIYLADWDTYGKSAGARRNKKMAEISDYVICFWDGKSKGTKIMIDYAKQFNKPLKIKKINNAKTKKHHNGA